MASTRRAGYPNSWKGVVSAAKAAGCRYSELVAAQWALESGYGKYPAGKGSHNYFGLKSVPGQASTAQSTEEVVEGKRVTITANFLTFGSLAECVSYLVDRWYKDWKHFEGVDRASTIQAAAQLLVDQGYCTDPDYVKKLLGILEKEAPEVLKQAQPVHFSIEAVRCTWLKKSLDSAGSLPPNEKVLVEDGDRWAVVRLTEIPASGHAEVELAYGAGTWFIYLPHWRKEQPAASKAALDWSDFSSMVTQNLSVGEVLQWDERRIPAPGMAIGARLELTAMEYQKVRDAWGGPLGVTSFYRPEPINAAVGGVRNSFHVLGQAFDVYPANGDLDAFYKWIRHRWTGGLGDGRPRGFVHLDTRNKGCFVPGAGVLPCAEWVY